MKATVKTSRVAGQLEKMFRILNDNFFASELPEVVISLKKTVGAYGHFTCSKVWQAGDERKYEINISTQKPQFLRNKSTPSKSRISCVFF